MKLFLLALVVVYIVDISGVMAHVKGVIGKALGLDAPLRNLRPFDCSLCMVFWCGHFYIAVAGKFDLWHIVQVCLWSMFAESLAESLRTLKDVSIEIIQYIGRLIAKLLK